MLLRMMRDPVAPGPSPVTRLVALALLVGMLGANAPLLIIVVRWVLGLL